MILGVGLDLTDVERIEKAVKNPRFLERIFSDEERAQIEKKGAQTAAGYFAAKEAVAKAFGAGFNGFSPWDISIRYDELGKPEVTLYREALRKLESLEAQLVVSITHSGGFAAAVAILSRD